MNSHLRINQDLGRVNQAVANLHRLILFLLMKDYSTQLHCKHQLSRKAVFTCSSYSYFAKYIILKYLNRIIHIIILKFALVIRYSFNKHRVSRSFGNPCISSLIASKTCLCSFPNFSATNRLLVKTWSF